MSKQVAHITLLNELAFLYELSLSIGKSLDLQHNCQAFVNTLLSKRNFDVCSVWLKADIYHSLYPDSEEQRGKKGHLLYAQPAFCVKKKVMPLEGIIFDILANKDFISISFPNEDFEFLLDNEDNNIGALALFRLRNIGYLKFFTSKLGNFEEVVLNQLTHAVNKFAIALEGCIAHQRVIVEIEQRKKAEKELEQKNKELQDFAYVVSHDLKAPLRGVSAIATFLAEDYEFILDEDGKENLALLKNRVKQMQEMINSILRYSRIGSQRQEKVEIDFNELIANVIELLAPPEYIQISVAQMPILRADKTRMKQLFQNLIGNAIKYMDKAEGKITVHSKELTTHWQFCITDNGAGIKAQDIERIFKIFQTVNPKNEESTGIGLTIVKKILELYDGKIWVESELGKGSAFYFTLSKDKC